MREICGTRAILSLYEDHCKEIECDYIMSNEQHTFKGRAIIKSENYNIQIHGSIKDIVLNGETEKIIKVSDTPSCYECRLINLPQENRRNNFVEYIEIKFPNVRILSHFTLNASYEHSDFIGDIQPLFGESDKVVTINI